MKYQEYLRSEHWQRLKKAVRHKKCRICRQPYGDVHHVIYRETWWDTLPSDLRKLCHDCHETLHYLIKSGLLKFKHPSNLNSVWEVSVSAVRKYRFGCTKRSRVTVLAREQAF